jgi:AraC-like DNA-binding protein
MLKQVPASRRYEMSVKILCVECLAALEGVSAKVVRPLGREEVIQRAREIRWDPQARCLLLQLPEGERRMSVMELEDWAECAEPHAQKVVACYSPNTRFACGEHARCQQHTPTIEREAMMAFNQLLERSESAEHAVSIVFGELKPRDQRVVQRWATAPDPEHPKRPIRIKILAKEVGLSERQVKNILAKARKCNATIYRRLRQLRIDRARVTHAKPLTDFNH